MVPICGTNSVMVKQQRGRRRILADRQALGLSLRDYIKAKRLKCWASYLSRVERGTMRPDIGVAAQWEKKLGMPGLTRELYPEIKGIK